MCGGARSVRAILCADRETICPRFKLSLTHNDVKIKMSVMDKNHVDRIVYLTPDRFNLEVSVSCLYSHAVMQ